MSTRKLLVLTGVFLALLAFVFFFERHQPTSEEAAKARKKLLDFETADVAAVSVERPDLPKVALTRGPEERWLVGGEPADAATVDGLVADLARLDLVGETRTAFDPKEFGLDAPVATVVLGLKGGASHTVLFGSELPGTDATAAATGGRFGAVKYAPMAALRKPLDDFRSKNLVDVPSTDVTRMTIAKGTSRIVVARPAGTATAGPGDWRLEEPVKDLASRTFVDQLLADLSSSRVSEFPSLGPSDLPRVGLLPPSATVTLQKGDQVVASLAFGASKADVAGKLYALRGKTPVVVDDRVQEEIAKELSAYRETKICPLDTWSATRLSVDLAGTVGGAEKVEGEWRSGGRTVPATAVEDLLERLSRIEARLFFPPKELPAHGVEVRKKKLPPPVATIEVAVEREPAPRLLRFYAATSPDAEPVLAVEATGRSDVMLVSRASVDELRPLLDGLRAAASGTRKTPLPAATASPSAAAPARAPSSAPVPPATR